jgi:hypothetical protein
MKLRPYMKEISTRYENLGMFIMYWRRQAGKTTMFGWIGLKTMAKYPGSLFTLVSASLNVGAELTEKEAKLYHDMIAEMRGDAEKQGLKLETNADRLQWDDYLSLIDKSKLEIKLWHSNSVYSRTKIIAPNVATARGYSGWVGLDEFGFIPDFKELFEAVEPIASSDPSFRIIMATTPPNDDSHYSFELLTPPDGMEFTPNPRGNWYESQAGITVHRLDALDAYAANVHLYDKKTRKPLKPEDHRAQALDRDAWDRNYGLILKAGGKSACSLLALQTAQQSGALTCCCGEDDFPANWRQFIVPDAPVTIGHDPATTENEKSNPSSIVISQKVAGRIRMAVIVRYKTADDRRQKAMLREACDLPHGLKPRRMGIDATNERYYSSQIQRDFREVCPVELFVGSETPRELEGVRPQEKMTMKSFLGNLLVNGLDDGQVELPGDRWVKDDWRLVVRAKGGFDNMADSAGNHGDTFDGAKIAYYLQTKRGGPADVTPMQVGSFANTPHKPQDRMRPDHSSDIMPANERATV